MYFTQEDYRKIEAYLKSKAVRDTSFDSATTPLKGNETVVLVQNGKNVKASIKDIVEQLFLLGVSDFVNITDKYGESYISLSQAIELIPYRSRKIGQVVTFLDDTGKWAMFQFQGTRKNQWGTLSLWVDLIDLMTGLTITDSEDIVTETNSANQVALKFADKVYSTTDYSGLGRVYLRKNIAKVEEPVTGNTITMNLLQQSMVSKKNTIYIVQYSYNLNKQTISIPEGSILVFEGGDINNGTINCNGTVIVGKFGGNATITGTYSFQDAQADEEDITQNQSSVLKFKDKEYDEANFSGLGRTYLRKNIVNGVNILSQDMINNSNTIYHIQYDYNLNGQTITIPEGCVLRFNGGTISNGELKGNLLNEYLKPEWFGAKGDNSVNDSIAFQMAINLCNNSNTCKTIKLGQKHYLLDNIILYSYITLEGADKYNTILSSFGKLTDSPLITTGIEQGQNITIKNLCIESEGARTEYTVKIINKLGVTIDNCYIVRHDIEAITDKHGIFIGRDSTTPNATVYIPKFTNNRVNQCCVTIEGTDGYIDHNEIWGIGCESALHLMKSGNHMISANQIVGGSVYGALYCTEWATALKIFGNYFDGSSTAVANVPFGINVTANLTYSIISNNNFWHLYGVGIKVTTSIGNTINGNVFENNDTSDVGNPDIVFTNTQSGSITNNSFVRAGVTRINKAPVLNITGYTGTSYEPIIISGNTVRGYTNYSNAVYTPIDSTIKTSNNNCSIFEYISNANQYKIFNPYGELNYNSSETIEASPLDAKVFTYVETNRKIRLDNLNYVDSTALTGDNKFDFNQIYNKDFNLYINNYGSVLNPPVWITGAMWLENRYLTTGYCRQIIYSSNGNPLYSRICSNSIWSEWVNADATLRSKVSIAAKVTDFSITDKIYKIISDINLNGQTLTIPANCTLDFQGGTITNGTIIGNATKIRTGLRQIFATTTTLSGSWDVTSISPEFFGAIGVSASQDTACIQKALDTCLSTNIKEVALQSRDYQINSMLTVASNCKINGVNSQVWDRGNATRLVLSPNITGISVGFTGVEIRDIKIVGNTTNTGISFVDSAYYFSAYKVVTAGLGIGFDIQSAWTYDFTLCRIEGGTIGFKIQQGTSASFNACVAFSCTEYGFYVNKLNYGSFNGCGTDGCKYGFYFTDAVRGCTLSSCGSENVMEGGYMVRCGARAYVTITAYSVGTMQNVNCDLFIMDADCRVSLIDLNVGSLYHPTGSTLTVNEGANVALINCYLTGNVTGIEYCTTIDTLSARLKATTVSSINTVQVTTPTLEAQGTQTITQAPLNSVYLATAVTPIASTSRGFSIITVPNSYGSAIVDKIVADGTCEFSVDSTGNIIAKNISTSARIYTVSLLKLR